MLLTDILPGAWRARRHLADNRVAAAANPKDSEGTIPYEMNLHVPCQVTGVTKTGSRWVGETATLSISSFGARLLLPVEAELDGNIVVTFKIPAPLKTLFSKRRFRIKAEVKPSGAAGPVLATLGRKAVCIVFSEPLYFKLKHARNRA
jgi:hypothetical protein